MDIRHVLLDGFQRYKEDVNDELNDILTLEANLDQTAREFKQDIFGSMLDEGYIAVCPIVADVNYTSMTVNKVQSARVGKIVAWYPKEIDVELYDENTGEKKIRRYPKTFCVILQNPFYEIMNAPNSLMTRLRRKLAILDKLDEKTASGKLDMIIQLPYSTRQETNRDRAETRRHDLEVQLNNSKYGIGYIDASEKVIQLGKPLDNNLQSQIENMTKQLMDQLGVSPEILNGSANEMTKLNYVKNLIEPIVTTLVDGLNRRWISQAARSRGHAVMSFHNPFRLVPVSEVAELGDKLLRNQILTPNEMRGILGFKPSTQEGADMLMNPNMPADMQFNPEAMNLAGNTVNNYASDEQTTNEELPADDEYAEDGYDDAE